MSDKPTNRNMSLGLAIGVIFIPGIFAWFTLRNGHSTVARVCSLGWMVFGFLILFPNACGNRAERSGQPIAATGMPAAPTTSPPTVSAAVAAPTPPPTPNVAGFAQRRADACTRYKDALNDIQRSEIFSEYFAAAEKQPGIIEGITGTLEGIETPQGGNIVWVKVSTSIGEFTNMGGLDEMMDHARDIKKGSTTYKTVGSLERGANIAVSAKRIIPQRNPFSEEQSVCGDGWIVTYSKISTL